MLYAVIVAIALVLVIVVYKVISKKKFRKETSELIENINGRLGSFIENSDEGIFLGKAELYKGIAVQKKYKFDEAVSFISYTRKLQDIIYKNNLNVLEQMMNNYIEMFTEMVGNAKVFIISPDIKPYADHFLREGDQFAFNSERYIADSDVIRNFMQIYSDPKQFLQNLNKKYIENEKNICNDLLSNIDGKSLDENQRVAVVNDDLRQLVIAGAGSGKTLTVSAKVKYLVERKGINPKDILLISFTRKAADEMGERICKLGIDIESSTFHKYGLNIIRSVNKKTPDVAEDIGRYIDKYLRDIIYNDNKLAKDFLVLLGTLMLPVFDGYKKIGERIEEEQRQDLTTIKGMYEAYSNKIKADKLGAQIDDLDAKLAPLLDRLRSLDERRIVEDEENERQEKEYLELSEMTKLLEQKIYNLKIQKLSIKNEKMKSAEEVMLANIFFLDGVDYQYEVEYLFDENDNYRKKYRPDFYIKESDVYWEHFGIDEEGRARQYSSIAEKEYTEGIKWKRNIHEENGTKLAETYSWQFRRNRIVDAVNANYETFEIKKHDVRYCDVIREILNGDTVGNVESFKTLLSTFIALFKSYGHSINKFDQLRGIIANYQDDSMSKETLERRKVRDLLFLEFAEKFYVYYTELLIQEEKIDFNDMIIQAAGYIDQGTYIPNYKYIIIDEYQDISVGRYKLAQATLEKSNAKLFCVGDDWQSIYRFTGSEVDLLVRFENYFGLFSRTDITQTYRNSQEFLDISGAFIQANDYQTPKTLTSNKHLENPIRIAWYTGSYRPVLENEGAEFEIKFTEAFRAVIKEIVEKFPKGDILLLGRNNSDLVYLSDDDGINVRQEEGEKRVFVDFCPNVKIYFLTVHRSKGLEADNIIILNARNAKSGFPNQIVDDPVLNLLRDTAETYPFAEERRLFYVALTRTRNYTYILAPITQSSRFLDDIKMLKENVGTSRIKDTYPNGKLATIDTAIDPEKTKPLSCPICKVGTLVKHKGAEGKIFVSCSNYPSCTYKAANIDAIRKNNRCPVCDNFLIKRKGINGEFMGCMSYPYCTYTTHSVVELLKPEPQIIVEQARRLDRYESKFAYNVANGKPMNSHVGWTLDEDYQLVDEFNSEKSVAEIAKIHQRSNGGITARLKKLGLIEG